MNYYRHFIGDYLRKTVHLTMILDGAYRRLMDEYYVSEKPLTLDRTLLYARVRAHTPEECCAVDSVLKEFFVETRRGFTNKKADKEIEYASSRANIARNNGLAGGRPKTQRVSSGLAKTATPSKAPQTLDSRLQTPEKEREVKTFRSAQTADHLSEFPLFWEAYPKKVAKLAAQKAWIKKGCEGRLGEILASVASWRKTQQWENIQFVPNPATWLNGENWKIPVPPGMFTGGNGNGRKGAVDTLIDTMQQSAGRPFGTYRETKSN